ncbi:SGNH/GDSL hydrolase family protein [Candidatus Uabimicrobium sp. HlEnr_7]|uniref:SGNH/GDSL hydrolase family protein n=1 Tax=Candidatus Uabimicrobium helgolandensis TaxID=3095367 RepID=UPI00355656AF
MKVKSNRKKKLQKLFLIVGGFVIGFVFMELILRVYHPFEMRLKGEKIVLPILRKYKIHNKTIPKLSENITHSKNILGFRGDSPPKDFKKYESIITIGGSTTECFYLSDNETWSALLEKKLKNDYKNIWLNNAGLDGHSTFGHIILLRDYIAKMRPKIVIFLVGANDIGRSDLASYDKSMQKNLNSYWLIESSEVLSLALNLYRVWRANNFGVAHQNDVFAERPRLELSTSVVNASIKKHELLLDGYANRLQKIVDLCREYGIKPIFVTQPTVWGNEQLQNVQVSKNVNGRLWQRIVSLYNAQVLEVANKNDVKLVDLARLMRKDLDYFYDTWHFSKKGARAVADIIYSHIVSDVK